MTGTPGMRWFRYPDADEQNPLLAAAIERQRQRIPTGAIEVATGAWAGSKDLFERDPATHPLRDWIESLLEGHYQLDAWGFIVQRGQRVELHDHRRSHRGGLNAFAGVYYIEYPPQSGQLIAEGADTDKEDPVRPGDLVIFDATFRHEITEHAASARRVSIAFNAQALTEPPITKVELDAARSRVQARKGQGEA